MQTKIKSNGGLNDIALLHCRESGNGPPLLLLHGLFDSLETWSALTPYLSGQFKLHALDLPGFGLSPLPEVWPCSISGMVDAVARYLDNKGLKKVSLVGNSMGGGLALAIAQQHPERIAQMMLLNPYGLPSIPMAAKGARRPIMGRILPYILRKSAITKCAKGIFSRSFHDNSLVSEPLLERVTQPFSSLQNRKNLFRFLRAISTEEIRAIDQKLPEVAQPVLILWGKEDGWLSDEHYKRLASRLPKVTVNILPECGHLPQIEKPETVAASLIHFLNNNPTKKTNN